MLTYNRILRFSFILITHAFFLFVMPSCEKLESDSPYNIDSSYLAAVTNPSLGVFDGGIIEVSAMITKKGPSDILRYGFLAGPSTNSFGFLEEGEVIQEFNGSVDLLPQTFSAEIVAGDISEDKNFIGAYVVNESGIAYSASAVDINPKLRLSSIDVLSDSNNNGQVNAGEQVVLRFNIVNLSPLPANSVLVSSINDVSGFITGIVPNQNIGLLPSQVRANVNSSFTATLNITLNANADIPVTINLIDSKGRETNLRTLDGSTIEIELI